MSSGIVTNETEIVGNEQLLLSHLRLEEMEHQLEVKDQMMSKATEQMITEVMVILDSIVQFTFQDQSADVVHRNQWSIVTTIAAVTTKLSV